MQLTYACWHHYYYLLFMFLFWGSMLELRIEPHFRRRSNFSLSRNTCLQESSYCRCSSFIEVYKSYNILLHYLLYPLLISYQLVIIGCNIEQNQFLFFENYWTEPILIVIIKGKIATTWWSSLFIITTYVLLKKNSIT